MISYGGINMRLPFIEAGEIVTTHGVRGEVKVLTWLDSPEMLCDFDRCLCSSFCRLCGAFSRDLSSLRRFLCGFCGFLSSLRRCLGCDLRALLDGLNGVGSTFDRPGGSLSDSRRRILRCGLGLGCCMRMLPMGLGLGKSVTGLRGFL